MSQRRNNFRIKYYPHDHAKFVIQGHKLAVDDISCGGLNFSIPEEVDLPVIGAFIRGDVLFQDGVSQRIAGKVIRTNPNNRSVVLRLAEGIPPKTMMEQHRQWINKYRRPS